MKTIKNILLILLVLLSAALNAQQVTNIFPGTWQYDNGSQRFIVKIWQEGNRYRGHYKMVELNAGIEGNTIYNSRMSVGNGQFYPPFTISGTVNNSKLSGFIYDNTIVGYDDTKPGQLILEYQFFPGCQNCNVTASWKVIPAESLGSESSFQFSVPTDITLTKVSDTVTWD